MQYDCCEEPSASRFQRTFSSGAGPAERKRAGAKRQQPKLPRKLSCGRTFQDSRMTTSFCGRDGISIAIIGFRRLFAPHLAHRPLVNFLKLLGTAFWLWEVSLWVPLGPGAWAAGPHPSQCCSGNLYSVVVVKFEVVAAVSILDPSDSGRGGLGNSQLRVPTSQVSRC
jgi:hypothetical protein